MASAGTLYVTIAAQTERLKKGLADARTRIGGFVSGGNKALLGLGAGLAGFASFNSITRSLGEASERIDRIGKSADRLGVTTEALIGLEHGAKLSGIEVNTLTTGLTKLQNLIGDAKLGKTEALDPLGQLGVSMKEIEKLSFDKQLGIIADQFAKIEDPATRTRIAMDLFGRSGSQLTTLLAGGSEGLREFQAETEKLGTSFSGEDSARVQEFNDKLERLKMSLGGAWQGFVIDIAPAALSAVDKLTDILGIQTGKNPFHHQMEMMGGKQFLAMSNELNAAAKRGANDREMMDVFARHGFMRPERNGFDVLMNRSESKVLYDRITLLLEAQNRRAEEMRKPPGAEKPLGNVIMGNPEVKAIVDRAKSFGADVTKLFGGIAFGAALNQASGLMSGNLLKRALGAVALGGDGAGLGMMQREHGLLHLTRSGSADSYRQQRAIERQSNPLLDINKKQENHLAAIRKSNEQIASQSIVLAPANIA